MLRVGAPLGSVVLSVGSRFWLSATGICDPHSAGFPHCAVLRIFIADPLGFPAFLEQACFPPAHVARRVGLSILVPNLNAPVIAGGSGQFGSAIGHAE